MHVLDGAEMDWGSHLFVHYIFEPSFKASDQILLSQNRIRVAQKNGRQFRNRHGIRLPNLTTPFVVGYQKYTFTCDRPLNDPLMCDKLT
jgi:hypothetical protein